MPICSAMSSIKRFNSQPPEGGWLQSEETDICHWLFQLTAARRRLVDDGTFLGVRNGVSTHSRPKAAGIVIAEVVAG